LILADILHRKPKKTGLPPGTPVYVGDEAPFPTHIVKLTYNESDYTQENITDIAEITKDLTSSNNVWIRVNARVLWVD
jgi:hypothetical protein